MGQGPAFVQRRILWPIVSRPQPFRDFKGSFAQFLLSATLRTDKQKRGRGQWFFNVKGKKDGKLNEKMGKVIKEGLNGFS